MANVIINDTNLTNIADAIREKNGTENTYMPSEMAAAIIAIPSGGGGELPPEALVVTGDCSYKFSNDNWNWFIENYGSQITTNNITNMKNMFYNSNQLEEIPFEINCKPNTDISLTEVFSYCRKLKEIPKINNCRPSDIRGLFQDCLYIRYLPEGIVDWFDWSTLDNATYAYSGYASAAYSYMTSLREFPVELLAHGNKKTGVFQYHLSNVFSRCFNLDEAVDIPLFCHTEVITSNIFSSSFQATHRLKNLTFLKPEGVPYVVQWKNQTIDLATYATGYANDKDYIISYNSGITADKEVTDAASYEALKNDPDWFTCNKAYSRYNHDSAVATINSLPDTSAYLTTAGGTNTIKFNGAAGSATDGGAINTLTEEEIAVAAAKGWTVTLS